MGGSSREEWLAAVGKNGWHQWGRMVGTSREEWVAPTEETCWHQYESRWPHAIRETG